MYEEKHNLYIKKKWDVKIKLTSTLFLFMYVSIFSLKNQTNTGNFTFNKEICIQKEERKMFHFVWLSWFFFSWT